MANLLDQASIVLTPTAYDNGKVLCAKPVDGSGDFDFSRNSAATRVNAQGLVEDVQILSSNLVQNGSFSQIGSEEITNGNFSQQGSQLITNGDFSNGATGWELTGNADISNGTGNFPGGGGDKIFQRPDLTQGKLYKITFDILNYTSGTSKVYLGSTGDASFTASANGSYSVVLEAEGTTDIIQWRSDSGAPFIGSIDNCSVVEVGQDWDLGTGWSIGDNKASQDGSATSFIFQNNILVSGKTYKVQYTISDYVSGNVRFSAAGVQGSVNGSNGVVTDFITVNSAKFALQGLNSFIGSITNISVKEVGQNWVIENTWTIGDGVANGNGANGAVAELKQNSILTVGRKFKVTYEIKNYVSGTVKAASGATNSGNGIYTDIFISTRLALAFVPTIFFGDITNISAIEITDDTNLPRINYEGFSYQDALGSELYDGNINQAINGGTWTDNGDGTFIVTGNGTPSVGVGVRDFNAEYLTIGKNYLITAIGDNLTIAIYSSSFALLASGASPLYFTPTTTSTKIYLSPTDGITATYSNVSVKEYLGQEVVPDSGCGSWLWEPQSTNLITYSEDATNWQTQNNSVLVTSNQAISPDGTLNADKLIPANGNVTSNGGRFIGFASAAGTNYSVSVFVKQGEYRYVTFSYGSASAYGFHFDLQDGVIIQELSSSQYTSISREAKSFGNGWYRLKISLVDNNAAGRFISVRPANALPTATNNNYSTIGDGTSGIYAWGLQLEEQSYSTSYIPTDGTSVTRNQDVCTNGGSAASINSSEGVLYFEAGVLVNDGTNRTISINDGSSNNRVSIVLGTSNNQIRGQVRIPGNQFDFSTTAYNFLNFNKIAIKYKVNDFALWVNGDEIAKDTSGDTPINLNRISFDIGNTTLKFFGKIKCVAVWKETLTDLELQKLTTI